VGKQLVGDHSIRTERARTGAVEAGAGALVAEAAAVPPRITVFVCTGARDHGDRPPATPGVVVDVPADAIVDTIQ